MLPANLEYLFLLFTLVIFSLSLFAEELRGLLTASPFWLALLTYLLLGFLLDLIALKLDWWRFDSSKLLGPSFFAVPLEEFLLFALVFLLATCGWVRFTSK